MNAGLNLLASEAWTHFTLTLLHTLWQAPLVAVALCLALRAVPVARPNRRYAASLVALGAVVLAAMLTWSLYRLDTPPLPVETSLSVSTSGPATAAPVAPVSSPAPAHRATWTAWLAVLWLAGTGAGLLRASLLVWRAGRMRRQATPWNEAAVQAALERLKDALGVARRVRVAVSDRIDVPGVIGLLRPVVVFPAAIVAGMPPAHLDAILAHELAHIRRYDYWVNLFQLLVESLLFFNPAVWWISRRIRIEREACCDALAASVTGLPVAYASALADLAERLNPRAAQPVLAVTGNEDKHVLLDRVKRLLVPGYRPRLGLPWYTLAALLIGGMVILAGLSQGVFGAVILMSHILTPTERVQKIQALEEEHAAPERDKSGEVLDKLPISGTVRTEDGAPLPERRDLTVLSWSPHSVCMTGVCASSDGRFDYDVEPGTIYMLAGAEGYAFRLYGPFKGNAADSLKGLDVVLPRGVPARIHVTAPGGAPVEGAKLSGGYQIQNSGTGSWKLETNQEGFATIDHYAGVPVAFTVIADGYARERVSQTTLDATQPLECRLQPTRPTSGVVTAEESGTPLAGVVLRVFWERGPQGNQGPNGLDGEELAITDSQGHFTLNTLREDTEYGLVAVGADGRRFNLGSATAGQTLNFGMPPPIHIRGRVIGDLNLLAKDKKGPYIEYKQSLQSLPNVSQGFSSNAYVEMRGAEGFFETEPLWPGRVTITASSRQLQLEVARSIDDFVIDLSPKKLPLASTRTLVLRFEADRDLPVPTGTVSVYINLPEREDINKDGIPIVNGEARVDIPVPSTVNYQLKGLVGYWAEDKDSIDMPEGSEPFVLRVPVKPAGAIHGHILNPDGSPASAFISFERVKEPEEFRGKGDYSNNNVVAGDFLISPIPFGVTCAVLAWHDQRMVRSEEIEINESNPIREVTLQFVQGEAIHGRVIDENGKPVSNIAVGLEYVSPYSGSYGSSNGALPDSDGRFTFEGVNPDIAGDYSLVLQSKRDYVPFIVPARPGGREYTITVKRGLVLHGKVVDSETGAPVKSARMTAMTNEANDTIRAYDAEGPTDADGAFRFSNLSPGTYFFYINGLPTSQEPSPVAGADTPVLLKVKRQ